MSALPAERTCNPEPRPFCLDAEERACCCQVLSRLCFSTAQGDMRIQRTAGHLPELRPYKCTMTGQQITISIRSSKDGQGGQCCLCAAPRIQALVLQGPRALNLAAPVRGMHVCHDLWEGAPRAPCTHEPAFDMCTRCRHRHSEALECSARPLRARATSTTLNP